MNAIILEINKYKNNDAIIKCLSENQIYDFLAKGVFKIKSANTVLNNPFLFIDLEFIQGKYKYPILKRFSIIESPMIFEANLTYFSTLLISNEILKKCLTDDEKGKLYFYLLRYLKIIKTNKHVKEYLICFLLKILNISGYGINLPSSEIFKINEEEKNFLNICYKNINLTESFTDDEPTFIDQLLVKFFAYVDECFDVQLHSRELFFK